MPIEVEDLSALVVPVRASASSAPEMSPEDGPVPYPTMGEISSRMWCEYDEDDDDSVGSSDDNCRRGDGGRRTTLDGGAGGRGAGIRGGKGVRHRLLRVSVQTLDGHVCDDEDEDSDTDDGESETDQEGDEDDDDGKEEFERFASTVVPPRPERRGRRNPLLRAGGRAGGGRVSGVGRREAGSRGTAKEEEEFDEVECQRRDELASVLRRLRAAIRRMDGVLTEEKVDGQTACSQYAERPPA